MRLWVARVKWQGASPPVLWHRTACAVHFSWIPDASGRWNVAGNWTLGGPPNSREHTVTFGDVPLSAPRGVVNEQDVTVKSVTFDSPVTYTVGGPGSVNLKADSAGTLPTINTTQGVHEFQLRVNLNDNTTANIATGATLEFNNRLNLNSNILTKTGEGTIAINNNILIGGGTLNCGQGICSGTGTISGDVNTDGGTISPGNSPGALTVNGNPGQVPEPSTILLLAVGSLGTMGLLCRRKFN